MNEQQILAARIAAYSTQVNKVIAEVKAAATNLQTALDAAIAAGNVVSPELQAAVDDLGTAIQTADDLNPDAAPV